ncbi:dicarboxylate transporter/tellurite-resistance protein TehA [Rhizobium sp. BK251]|uniref:dicarboxylate transporter/tellurite-resistance protein TehA n=1 Tax=Rhizobium sp. BK251 TaxID=2512125 RepID=UPI0010439662|nr:dicarboxylate transporter/tellurite-resistance protein TehA [Rhizobium sp. BK251]TCL73679.1 tellurite resistance protein [Rhizobium sp. BK251]
MSIQIKLPVVPAAYFGMVLGLAGLAADWRLASRLWSLPAIVGETLAFIAVFVWALVALSYGLKWILARQAATTELNHPVQCCFIGLAGVATMLAAGCLLPYARTLAAALFTLGAVFTLLFAIWRAGGLWQGGREPGSSTPVLYLPAVAGSFVTAAIASALGYPEWGQLAFGAGFFSWLAIESVLLHRLLTEPPMPAALRPTLGIQLAPSVVGAVAYLSVTSGPPDIFAHALLGYGILQALILLRLVFWIRQEPFAPSYWAFTFGATALAAAPLRMIERGEGGAVALIAPVLFIAANVVVLLIAAGTLWLVVRGRLPLSYVAFPAEPTDGARQLP